MQTKKRPVFLEIPVLVRVLPVPGIVSILHRASGVIMFLMIPVLLMLLDGSLGSGESFVSYKAVASHPLVKLILIGVLWAFLHHLCAGVRFLLLDAHKGLELQTCRKTAKLVLAVSLSMTLVLGVALW
ncbi:Succinate dehydrogenase cytochrome b556 subunit [Kingella potus]|uniref:Succinate dehydrogenase cytochrome b556 subunit n=1 Tax=Kingella potus TaxID=265175 RepID=A0A377R2S6_9NEIS|nr:succinate dehydrogenase, cytochrome b556 subunit [Kingella potus]UOO99960.1 succinate dehydrogenase, cytochrome b556 subunit [Kingella potus]STR03238.1 Succinate dehydrogenase cytochrome b556 subunit [Kingella potus]